MSFSLPPAETISIILNEPCLCNQTITHTEESIEVNRFILAAHSSYFRSLWFLEFGGRYVNPIDFSHLHIDSHNFLAFIKSFYGQSFTLNENNAYDFYYLVHYFQVDKLIVQVENHLNTNLMTWAWLKPFIEEAKGKNDLAALDFVRPFVSKIDDVMAITTEGINTISRSSEILFSQTRKHPQLDLSEDRKRVDANGIDWLSRNILGEDPLLPGNVYTWKLRYQGSNRSLVVGVIDESKFSVEGHCFENAHCFHNSGKGVFGCLSGNKTQWNPGELLEINVNLINYVLTIKSVSNSSINLSGTLPRLSSGNYYPFAYLCHSDHVLEIVE
ncbi:hypothetical protein GEMRC1_004820 [Eukaryota sp. GEM-RC1]